MSKGYFKSKMATIKTLFTLNLLFFVNCGHFEDITVTVYRSNHSIVLVSTDSVANEKDAVEIVTEDQNIPVLHTGTFAGLVNLEYIKLVSCNITTLEAYPFLYLPKLRSIILNFNAIEEIPEKVFENLVITKLSLCGNVIKTVKPNAFYNLTYLEELDLSHNSISVLSSDIFYRTGMLRKIDLSYNKLEVIPPYFFYVCFSQNNDEHKTIDLSHNYLKEIKEGDFKGVRYIELLNLEQNFIKFFDIKAFKDLRGIEHVDVRGNCIDRTSYEILTLIKIMLKKLNTH